MLDKWFKLEIENKLKEKNRLVIIDEQGACGFLLELIDKERYAYYEVDSAVDEIKVKYSIEKNDKYKKSIIYTRTRLEHLKFVREYCETNSKIHVKYLDRYINDKAFENLNDSLKLSSEELIAVGKQSFGKDISYWKKVNAIGIQAIFENFDAATLKFLDMPTEYLSGLDSASQRIFLNLIKALTKSDNLEKPAQTIAKELSKAIFDNLIFNDENETLNNIYKLWTDSKIYEPMFLDYVFKYEFPQMYNLWNVSINHPFKELDKKWLKEISLNIENKEFIKTKLKVINRRAANTYANLVGVTFWEHISALISFDYKQINELDRLDDLIEFYKTKFYKIDTAMRYLYAEYLNDKELLKPIQEYYQTLLSVFLNKWFNCFDTYKENQTGLLKSIINSEPSGTAIIVGDGLSYEVTQEIVKKLGNVFKITNNHTLADFPSETENNMSRLFISSGKVEAVQSKREQFLREDCKKNIEFIEMENITHNPVKTDYLICKVKDIDSLGEKFQHQGLKYFDTIESEIITKIKTLLNSGFKKVYITTDHGFVLSGILTDSDKVNFSVGGDCAKNERYIASNIDVSPLPSYIIKLDKTCKSFKNLYFSKGIAPFITTGAYGYSHGGLAPQELIIPLVSIEKEISETIQMKVHIENKEELADVAGNVYSVKLKGSSDTGSLFAMERKIEVVCMKNSIEFYRSDIKMVKAEATMIFENRFVHDEFELIITDYASMETLDKVNVRKKIIRDMGGL